MELAIIFFSSAQIMNMLYHVKIGQPTGNTRKKKKAFFKFNVVEAVWGYIRRLLVAVK